jgi:hypothetical protein
MTMWYVCRRPKVFDGRGVKHDYEIFTEEELNAASPAWELASPTCDTREEGAAWLQELLKQDQEGPGLQRTEK